MMPVRTPEECPYRAVAAEDQSSAFFCRAVAEIADVTDEALCSVDLKTCRACCQSLRDPTQVNSVVASLLYKLASRVISSGGHPQCSLRQARTLQSRATDQLSFVMAKLPQQQFPPSAPSASAVSGSPSASASASASAVLDSAYPQSHELSSNNQHAEGSRGLVWASALLTAPRQEPQIDRTLDSLRNAGITDIHIFAEPGSWIPDRYRHLPTTHRTARLGNLLNFYDCLATLLRDHPA
ncbi:MAG: hypothetical protein KDA89_20380, partial [Planctomycetaceae bacterium]|nr:hypothetical protein [Planctomycetaceae bacterium]